MNPTADRHSSSDPTQVASGQRPRAGPAPSTRLREKILMLLAGLVVGAVIAEVALRLHGEVYSVVAYDPDPALRYTLIPGMRGWIGGVEHRYNSRGLRDREYPAVPPAGTVRVLCLGDSITFSQPTPLERTFPKLMESSLNARGDGRTYEVLNAGVSGYNACQEEALLRKVGLGYKPHLVVWQYCLNDVDAAWDPYGGVNTGFVPLPLSFKRFAREHIKLWGFLQVHTYDFAQRTGLLAHDSSSEEYADHILSIWDEPARPRRDESWECIRRGRASIEAAAAETLVVVFPMAMQAAGQADYSDQPQQEIAQRCRQDGLACLDLLPAFRSRGGWDLYRRPDFLHLSERGQQVTAETILPALEGLMPPPVALAAR